MAIEQAMAVARSRTAGAAHLQTFIESAIASGFAREAIARHHASRG